MKKIRMFEVESVVGIEHAGFVLKKTFKKAADAWDWAIWNYKGRNGWKLVRLEKLHYIEDRRIMRSHL